MSDPKSNPAPVPNPADVDRPVCYPNGAPANDRAEGPCSCGGPHLVADCPLAKT